jgi:hypothetical protein
MRQDERVTAHRTLRRNPALWLAAVAPLTLSACLQDHNVLAEQPGVGGAGGVPGVTKHSSGGAPSVVDAGGGGGTPPAAPDGPRTLTVVHGVIDSPWIALCFTRVSGGVESPAVGNPLPASGLEYGHSAVFDSLPGIDFNADGVRAYLVLARGPSAAAGLDCAAVVAQADAPPLPPPPRQGADGSVIESDARAQDAASLRDATTRVDASVFRDAARDGSPEGAAPAVDAMAEIPPVRAVSLPVIPEGQLSVERSYLLVPSGCVGGPGVTDPSERSVCGEFYSPDTPTLVPLLVALSRAGKPNRVALGFLDAAPAFSGCDVRLTPPLHGDAISVAQNVAFGALRPRPPTTASSVADIGATASSASIQIYPGGSGTAAYNAPWLKTMNAGDLITLQDGEAYTLIFVGPYPGFSAQRWWNDPLVTVVKN